MRETGTMWQIGVPTGKPGSKVGHFRRFGTAKIRREFRGFGRKMPHSFYLS